MVASLVSKVNTVVAGSILFEPAFSTQMNFWRCVGLSLTCAIEGAPREDTSVLIKGEECNDRLGSCTPLLGVGSL